MAVILAGVVLVTTFNAVKDDEVATSTPGSSPSGSNRSAARDRPRIGEHWHVGYRVFLCDRLLAPVQDTGDRGGIHSHGDGFVHVEPTATGSAGANATFRRFEEAVGLEITSSSMRWVDGSVPASADVSDGCLGQEAEIVTFVNGRRTAGPPGAVRLQDGQAIVVALAPVGAELSDLGHP